jgi:hypothetical protein
MCERRDWSVSGGELFFVIRAEAVSPSVIPPKMVVLKARIFYMARQSKAIHDEEIRLCPRVRTH